MEKDQWIHAFYDHEKKQIVIAVHENPELFKTKEFANQSRYKWLGSVADKEMRITVTPKIDIRC